MGLDKSTRVCILFFHFYCYLAFARVLLPDDTERNGIYLALATVGMTIVFVYFVVGGSVFAHTFKN